MAVNGKNKGNSFERVVVKEFKELFHHDGFERNAFSGSLYGGSNRFRMQGKDKDHTGSVVGDIIVPTGFPMTVECKAYKELDFHNIIQGSSRQLDEWIEQAEEDANSVDKNFILVIKINNKGTYVLTNDLSVGSNSVSNKLKSYSKYKDIYYMYSFDLFKEICQSLDIIVEWNYK
jgi:hypothetical protein